MSITVQNNISLKPYTTLQVGGDAEYFVSVDSEYVLDEAVGYAVANNLPLTILGGGSNVLVSEQGVHGLTLQMNITGRAVEFQTDGVFLTAGAGEVLDDVVAHSVAQEYWGMENLSHIPGTVGATPVQNVGAYGVEVKDIISSVRVYNIHAQKFEVLTNAECRFGYRDSIFKQPDGKKYIVVAVTYRLSVEPRPNLVYADLKKRFADTKPTHQAVRDAVIAIRSQKFPDWNVVGTAGSFFKNPVVSKEIFDALAVRYPGLPGFAVDGVSVKIPLGWILDKILHIKGKGTAHVASYKEQALVLINTGGATSTDIIDFATDIADQVEAATGIEVHWEVTKLGFV